VTEGGAVTSLRIRRTFAVPRDRVFDAWTDAAQIKEWFGRPDDVEIPRVDADVRVGGSYRIQFESPRGSAAIVGVYREVTPVERLAFTFAWDPPVWDVMKGDEMLVIVDFVEVNGHTEVVLTHERLQSADASAFHEEGWGWTFDRLETFLAQSAA
jgi:uncharacterized protein YndB with AHSA1/START domain